MKERTIKPSEANVTPVTPLDAEHAGHPPNGGAGTEEVKKAEEIAQLKGGQIPGAVEPSVVVQAHDSELFNRARLRVAPEYAARTQVKKALITIPVKKPGKQTFFQIHPDPAYHDVLGLLELQEEKEVYLCGPELLGQYSEIRPYMVFTYMTRQKVLGLWPVPQAGPTGRIMQCHETMMEIATAGMTKWVQMVWNESLKAHDMFFAEVDLGEPEWPSVSFERLLEIAFKGKVITSLDHPVIQLLQGKRL